MKIQSWRRVEIIFLLLLLFFLFSSVQEGDWNGESYVPSLHVIHLILLSNDEKIERGILPVLRRSVGCHLYHQHVWAFAALILTESGFGNKVYTSLGLMIEIEATKNWSLNFLIRVMLLGVTHATQLWFSHLGVSISTQPQFMNHEGSLHMKGKKSRGLGRVSVIQSCLSLHAHI